VTGRERQHAALPEAQAGEQVQRDDREIEPSRDPAEYAEPEQQRAEFDEQHGDMRLAAAARCHGQPDEPSKDVGDLINRRLGAHRDDEIAGVQHEVRRGGGQRRALAQHGDDRRAGARPSLRITERAGGVGRIGRHGQLLDDQPLGLALQHGQPERQLRGAEYLGDGVGLVVGELDVLGGAVAVLVVQDQIAQAAAPRDDAQAPPVVQHDLLAYADARQHPTGDVHSHVYNTTDVIALGSLEWSAVNGDLVAAPVAAALGGWDAEVAVAPIDPTLADTQAFCDAYGVALEDSANCVVIAGRRGT